LWRALRSLPESTWAVLFATACVFPVCHYADRRLPPESSERMLWTALQSLAGLATIFLAQVWAFGLLRRRERSLTFGDVIFPAKLWRHTFISLPETGGPLSLCGGGCLVILTAVLWIGGWKWWLQGDSSPDTPSLQTYRPEAPDWRDRYKQLKGAVAAVNTPPSEAKPKTILPKDPRPTTQCVVIGYIPGDDGRSISGLVVATLRQGQLTYAGTVRSGFIPEQSPALLKKLAKLSSEAPLLNGVDVKAKWVKPELFCEVHQSGFDDNGVLVDPKFKGIIAE
jgi:hypothetical protein